MRALVERAGSAARAERASHVVDHNMETASKPLSHNDSFLWMFARFPIHFPTETCSLTLVQNDSRQTSTTEL